MEGGIDEAGRGPVLGPLVVAGVATADPQALWDMGCRDSKTLSAGRRERLARLLHDDDDVHVVVETLDPAALDAERAKQTLNDIEVDMFRRVARRLPTLDRLIVDAADVDAARFGARIGTAVPGVDVVSEHQADGRHATVAAASIIAKTTRDAAIAELARRLERRLAMPLGSGYPSDPATRAFLAAWLDRFGDLPPGTRRSWRTATDMLASAAAPRRASLDEFSDTTL